MIEDMPSGLESVSKVANSSYLKACCIPFLREFVAKNFRKHQCVVKGKNWDWLNDASLQSSCLDMVFFFLFDSTFPALVLGHVSHYRCLDGASVLGCGFAPVFIDSIFQLDDREIPDFERNRII